MTILDRSHGPVKSRGASVLALPSNSDS